MKKPAQPKPHNRPASHNFRGITYLLKWRRPIGQKSTCGGTCSPPSARRPIIEIDPGLSEFNTMRVLLDEGIHACLWDLDNDSVDEVSTCLAYLLWQHGIRFTDRNDKPVDIRNRV